MPTNQGTSSILGVIDLGTNTFHLLIAELDGEGGFREIYRERRFVKLAEEGIERIGEGPWQRGLAAMIAFAEQIDRLGAQRVRAIGTAALRTAVNGRQFVQAVGVRTGLTIELIDGQEEALLIHRGASLAVPFGPEPRLLMDIGGGSVEFILADAKQVYWSDSFPIGVAVLFRDFHHRDPLTEEEVAALRLFLAKALQPLHTVLQENPVTELVGASGTFDVLETYLVDRTNPVPLPVNRIAPFRDQLIHMPLADRLQMTDMPPARAEMLPVALVLLDVVIELAQIQYVHVSPYALKEGVLAEMVQEV